MIVVNVCIIAFWLWASNSFIKLKRRLEKFRPIPHVAVLLDVMDNLMYEGNLLLIKQLIVEKFKKAAMAAS